MSVSTFDSGTSMQLADMHHNVLPPLQTTSSDSLSTSTTAAPLNRVSTPPSSLSSTNQSPGEANQTSPASLSGRKRTATGHVKDNQNLAPESLGLGAETGHTRHSSNISNSSHGVVELSQQLRTRLTYAMLKVQNGWQHRSLEEVESIASQSPRSTTGFSQLRDTSPRTNMSTHLQRKQSNSSSGSDTISAIRPHINGNEVSPTGKRVLAPPANIVSGQRRRPTPNIHVQPTKPIRPLGSQRTPSQNAAMEADAVETLLFMASPNNSGHHPPTYSPITTSAPSTQQHPSQISPLRSHFSPKDHMISPKRVAFSSDVHSHITNKDSMFNIVVEKLDDESNAELDEAVRLIDHHHTAKVST